MNEEQRARLLDEAMDANEEAIGQIAASEDLGGDEKIREIVILAVRYCKEHGWEDAASGMTLSELRAALGRAEAARTAEADRMMAGSDDLKRLTEILSKASFDAMDMPMREIVAEMQRRGELSDDELREIEGIAERLS